MIQSPDSLLGLRPDPTGGLQVPSQTHTFDPSSIDAVRTQTCYLRSVTGRHRLLAVHRGGRPAATDVAR